jgi:deferrochelatase/peroxidase EfeB
MAELAVRTEGPSAAPARSPGGVDFTDLQGLVRFGHGRLGEASFLLLRVADAEAARAWLRTAPVTSAVRTSPPPETALQVAFTSQGLRALGLPPAVVEGFSEEFISGMAGEASRSRRLGDVGANAPAGWRWGGSEETVPHLLVMLYALPDGLEAWRKAVEGEHWRRAFEVQAVLPTFDMGEIEPFGFADGLSEPRLDWQQTLRLEGGERLDYGNLLALGEFVLGYRNEYGLHTERPLLDPATDFRAEGLPPAEDAPGWHDLGRNGTYLVFRQLHQDVRAFWRFVDREAGGVAERRWALAEAMVGRTQAGVPLAPLTPGVIAGVGPGVEDVEANQFTYATDPDGTRCPFGAHVRRANPRTADLPGGDAQGLWSRLLRALGLKRASFREDLVAPARFHRLVRRGREYGTFHEVEEALRLEKPDEETGLHFICLVANISRQFEFVQNAWMEGTKFAGLTEEGDPLIGNREPLPGCRFTDGFTIPRADGPARFVAGLPRFVTVRGGAYFFLPGIRALRYIAGGPP